MNQTNMPRGTSITEAGRVKIDVLRPGFFQDKDSKREIARQIKRSGRVVQNYLQDSNDAIQSPDWAELQREVIENSKR